MRKPLLALVLTSFCVVAWKVRWAVLVTIDWADPTNTVPPVQFDAQRRRWQANHLPEPPARAEGLSLPLNSMTVPDNVTPVIVAAAWTDHAFSSPGSRLNSLPDSALQGRLAVVGRFDRPTSRQAA